MVEWTGVHYGDTVDLGQASIAVTDGKYYAKGARPAGLDNVKDTCTSQTSTLTASSVALSR